MKERIISGNIVTMLLVLCCVHIVFGNTVNCPCSADAAVQSWNPDTNEGSANWFGMLCDLANEYYQNTFIRFDISQIPDYSTIISATVFMYVYACSPYQSGNFDCYRVTGNWAESTITWNYKPGCGGNPGFEIGNPSVNNWFGIGGNGARDIVQLWVNGTANYGLRLGSYAPSPNEQYLDAYSKENGASYAPFLMVEYEPPGGPIDQSTWAGIKAEFQ